MMHNNNKLRFILVLCSITLFIFFGNIIINMAFFTSSSLIAKENDDNKKGKKVKQTKNNKDKDKVVKEKDSSVTSDKESENKKTKKNKLVKKNSKKDKTTDNNTSETALQGEPEVVTLMNKPVANIQDAMKSIIYFVSPEMGESDIKVISDILIKKRIIDKENVKNINSPISKGLLASMIMKSKNWGGGIWYSILGGERYAYKELVNIGIFSKEGNQYQNISGIELLGIISKVDDYTNENM